VIRLSDLPPYDPRRRALQVLVDCEVAEPPVDEQCILDYFSVDLDQTPISHFPHCKTLATSAHRPSGALLRGGDGGRPLLWVDPAATTGRFRWTVFHELAHHDLDHSGLRFADDDSTLRPAQGRPEVLHTEYHEVGRQAVLPGLGEAAEEAFTPVEAETADSIRVKQQERQANLYASEMIMPSQWFTPEARDLPVGMAAVQRMRARYLASFEATAIRYAQACPDKCAVLAVEPTRDPEGNITASTVVYCIRGRPGFLQGIHQDAQLPFSGLFAKAWSASDHVEGIVTGDLLGLGRRFELSADALKLGSYGRVVALLWLESGQLQMLPERAAA